MSIQEYAAVPVGYETTDDGEYDVLKYDFTINRTEDDVHDRLVDYLYDVLKESSQAEHAVTGDDITGLRMHDNISGLTVDAYREEMRKLFGYDTEVGRYSIVKELPYYHLVSYPDGVAAETINQYISSEDSDVAEAVAVMPPQEIGDMDVAVFDRETRTVHLKEVKGRRKYIENGRDSIDKFAVYAQAFGWDVEGDVVVFNERDRHGNTRIIGNIEEYPICDTRNTE